MRLERGVITMGTKNNPGEFDAYSKALPDEPIFTLLGRDPLARELVLDWANRRYLAMITGAIADTEQERRKIAEARHCAMAMSDWYTVDPLLRGIEWTPEEAARMAEQPRPVLDINRIARTVEQIKRLGGS
jgi:hypothetical protein